LDGEIINFEETDWIASSCSCCCFLWSNSHKIILWLKILS